MLLSAVTPSMFCVIYNTPTFHRRGQCFGSWAAPFGLHTLLLPSLLIKDNLGLISQQDHFSTTPLGTTQHVFCQFYSVFAANTVVCILQCSLCVSVRQVLGFFSSLWQEFFSHHLLWPTSPIAMAEITSALGLVDDVPSS